MKKLTKIQTRMINLIAEELAAAISLRDRDPENRDMFAAGVADGLTSTARWLDIEDAVDVRADLILAMSNPEIS